MPHLADAKSLLKFAQNHVPKVVPGADLTALAVSFTLIRAADRQGTPGVSKSGATK
jgi:hypothetical protein